MSYKRSVQNKLIMGKAKAKAIVFSWTHNNIYNHRLTDCMLYLILYIIIPIIITGVSLYSLDNSVAPAVYCYLTIFISAANCIYDAINRWKHDEKSVINTKIVIIILFTGIVFVYCIFEIISILILEKVEFRFDCFLWAYFGAVIVVLIDIASCFAKNLAICEYLPDIPSKKEVD